MEATVGLLADTHGVFDPAAAALLKGVQLVLHAGDVGHHGGHADVLKAYADATGAPILAVAGNVDDTPDATALLPQHRLVDVAGWRVLLVHIVAPGPHAKVEPETLQLVKTHQPDLVVFGHSHKAGSWCAEGVHFINPGSAGPARFRLPRTVAILRLPYKADNKAQGTATAGNTGNAGVAGAQHEQGHTNGYAADSLSSTWGGTPLEDLPPVATNPCSGNGAEAAGAAGFATADQLVVPEQGNDDSRRHQRQHQLQPKVEFLQLPQKAPPRLKVSRKDTLKAWQPY